MWLRDTTGPERRSLIAAFAGYGLDGFDYMIYTFLIPTLLGLWAMSKAEAGFIATGALLSSAVGGWAAGVLADRHGRVRILQLTVLWFALFTFLSGFTTSYPQLLLTRSLQGLGFGGEWSVGSVLIAETIAARYRGRAVGLVQSSWAVGWALAALSFWGIYALAPPVWAWRIVFWVGVLPVLPVLYVRRLVNDPAVYLAHRRDARNAAATDFLAIFARPLLPTTLLASMLCGGMLGAYYAVTTWLPTFLATERHLSVAGTTGYLLILISGSFAGYLTNAWACDRLGRRLCFSLFAACGIAAILAYTQLAVDGRLLLALGFPLGFFNSGIMAGCGAYLAELYPTSVRGSGQGFSYNAGRALGALCPALIGRWSQHGTLTEAISLVTVGSYVVVIVAAWALPETRGRSFTAVPDGAGG
jgi:MFS family permease